MKLEDLFCLTGGRPRITVKRFSCKGKEVSWKEPRVRESVTRGPAGEGTGGAGERAFKKSRPQRTHPR